MNIPDSDLPAIRSALRAAKNYSLNVARAGGGGGYKKAAARYDAILKRMKKCQHEFTQTFNDASGEPAAKITMPNCRKCGAARPVEVQRLQNPE